MDANSNKNKKDRVRNCAISNMQYINTKSAAILRGYDITKVKHLVSLYYSLGEKRFIEWLKRVLEERGSSLSPFFMLEFESILKACH